jgi:hypothetical protein
MNRSDNITELAVVLPTPRQSSSCSRPWCDGVHGDELHISQGVVVPVSCPQGIVGEPGTVQVRLVESDGGDGPIVAVIRAAAGRPEAGAHLLDLTPEETRQLATALTRMADLLESA